jgi:hypothetical protein
VNRITRLGGNIGEYTVQGSVTAQGRCGERVDPWDLKKLYLHEII